MSQIWAETYDDLTGQCSADSGPSSKNDGVIALANKIQKLRADFEDFNGNRGQVPTNGASDAKPELPRSLSSQQLPYDKTLPLEVSSYLAHGADGKATPPAATESDYRMAFSASYGADILQRGKDDLMKRLEPFPERKEDLPPPHILPETRECSLPPASTRRTASPAGPRTTEYASEEDSEDDDFGVPGDDGRGLLTDVPLILGPNEIEVLPMIILSGIVPPPATSSPGYGSTSEETLAIRNMHTVRCHFLLAQDNGRNLLRELLIFVAAWDLREDELYFKFMVKIMEAILNNGLMPFSYHAFRE